MESYFCQKFQGMGKDKLKRFAEIETFKNVFQPLRTDLLEGKFEMKGNWRSDFFQNDKPLVLELGCGRGEYTVGMAREFPEKNFIGLDIKGARIWRGAKTSLEEPLPNAAFLRTQIELIDQCFEQGEVDEIWITFPDPQIKFRRTKKRLTHPDFLEKYRSILKDDGIVHLKTDSEFLHGFTLGILDGYNHEILYATHDLYGNTELTPVLKIRTHYESIFSEQGKKITYLKFRINGRK